MPTFWYRCRWVPLASTPRPTTLSMQVPLPSPRPGFHQDIMLVYVPNIFQRHIWISVGYSHFIHSLITQLITYDNYWCHCTLDKPWGFCLPSSGDPQHTWCATLIRWPTAHIVWLFICYLQRIITRGNWHSMSTLTYNRRSAKPYCLHIFFFSSYIQWFGLSP